MFWLRVNMKRIWNRIKECLKDESGIGVVEILLLSRCRAGCRGKPHNCGLFSLITTKTTEK